MANSEQQWRTYDIGNTRHFVPFHGHEHHIVLDEGERQMVLMALADLSLTHPGFDYALNEMACKIDNVIGARAVMYDEFRRLHEPRSK